LARRGKVLSGGSRSIRSSTHWRRAQRPVQTKDLGNGAFRRSAVNIIELVAKRVSDQDVVATAADSNGSIPLARHDNVCLPRLSQHYWLLCGHDIFRRQTTSDRDRHPHTQV
jgi:hypothetical protein